MLGPVRRCGAGKTLDLRATTGREPSFAGAHSQGRDKGETTAPTSADYFPSETVTALVPLSQQSPTVHSRGSQRSSGACAGHRTSRRQGMLFDPPLQPRCSGSLTTPGRRPLSQIVTLSSSNVVLPVRRLLASRTRLRVTGHVLFLTARTFHSPGQVQKSTVAYGRVYCSATGLVTTRLGSRTHSSHGQKLTRLSAQVRERKWRSMLPDSAASFAGETDRSKLLSW